MAHHPEKFLDGHMLWRGRIYSPLPFIRSLYGTKINAGVWGTAAFPSVYRTDVHPVRVPAALDPVAGAVVPADAGRPRHRRAGDHSVGGGAPARHRRDRPRWRPSPRTSPTRSDRRSTRCRASKLWYRAAVAYLHFIQPLARARGRIRGVLSPPEIALPQTVAQKSHGPRPSLGEALARDPAAVRHRHRGPLLERDVDVFRARAVAARRLAAPIARGPRDRDRRRMVRRSRPQYSGRPLGLARCARARRGSRRRQGDAARQHAPAADDAGRRQRARRSGSRCSSRRCSASRSDGRRRARSRAA